MGEHSISNLEVIKMGTMCVDGVCSKCWGMKYLVIGIVFIAARWYTTWDIWVVIGVLLVLKGLMKFAMPMGCSHCQGDMTMKKGKK